MNQHMQDPTEAERADPLFDVIWNVIKGWDIGVPEAYPGYCGATAAHVAILLRAVRGAIGSGVASMDDQDLCDALTDARVEERKRIADWLDRYPSLGTLSFRPGTLLHMLNGTLPGENEP